MKLNESKLHDLLGKVVTEMGAAANGPLVTIGEGYTKHCQNQVRCDDLWWFNRFKRASETPFNLILEARP